MRITLVTIVPHLDDPNKQQSGGPLGFAASHDRFQLSGIGLQSTCDVGASFGQLYLEFAVLDYFPIFPSSAPSSVLFGSIIPLGLTPIYTYLYPYTYLHLNAPIHQLKALTWTISSLGVGGLRQE